MASAENCVSRPPSLRAIEVTTKRGLASPCVHSALATTRRRRLQLDRVSHMKVLKRRAGVPAACGSKIEFGLDLGGEPFVFGETEEKVYVIGLAPRHEVLPREA